VWTTPGTVRLGLVAVDFSRPTQRQINHVEHSSQSEHTQWCNFKFCPPPLQKAPYMGHRPGDVLEPSAKISFFPPAKGPLDPLGPRIAGSAGGSYAPGHRQLQRTQNGAGFSDRAGQNCLKPGQTRMRRRCRSIPTNYKADEDTPESYLKDGVDWMLGNLILAIEYC